MRTLSNPLILNGFKNTVRVDVRASTPSYPFVAGAGGVRSRRAATASRCEM